MQLDAKIPPGPLETKWSRHRDSLGLVSPAKKGSYTVIVVGSGLAGSATAAALAEQGYQILCFCIQDTPRRAHSVSAQGGINGARNYSNDGDSTFRLFCDTIKGGDFRAREANVYRLAQLSGNIIDQCVAQGVPFTREYGGTLATRSVGGTQVSRTFYARGQTGQQLLLAAYQALERQIGRGAVKMFPRTEMLDLVVADGRARGIVVRDTVSGQISWHLGDVVVLGTGGYGNVFFLSTNAKASNATAIWRAYKKGASFANPCFTQIHPTCIPVSGPHQSKLTLMSEALRNDGRLWVPKQKCDPRAPEQIPEAERDYYLERQYPRYGNLVPRDIASRSTKVACDKGYGVGPGARGVYLDLSAALRQLGEPLLRERYGTQFEVYQRITGVDPTKVPMRTYPAIHYTMGGLWVDYNLMSDLPGLFVVGEANFADHGANRVAANSLLQTLTDGYFIVPYTVSDYLAKTDRASTETVSAAAAEAAHKVHGQIDHILHAKGRRSVDWFHRELGQILWDRCGMARDATGLREALRAIPELRERFYQEVSVPGSGAALNQSLERACRVADYLELGELMCRDALHREESCGSHFRQEHQTPEGEAERDDDRFCYVAAWQFRGEQPPVLVQEPLTFESVKLSQRNYK